MNFKNAPVNESAGAFGNGEGIVRRNHKNFMRFVLSLYPAIILVFAPYKPEYKSVSAPGLYSAEQNTFVGGYAVETGETGGPDAAGTGDEAGGFDKAAEAERECEAAANSCSAAVLIEANTGKILFEKNRDARLPMASTTKAMTALVAIENCSLEDMVEIPGEAVGIEGSSMYLKQGEKVSVKDLLYGLMLLSGNDAAVALAIHIGGGVQNFVELMNERAEMLGLADTRFVTPNGLHDKGHYTTAYELALIGAEAMRNEVFREIVCTRYYVSETGEHMRAMRNKNSLLTDYEGACGIKTGYTAAAGRCLLFAAERNGMLLVGTVLNCRPMFNVSAKLLNYGFENYTLRNVLKAGDKVAGCFVKNGTKSILPLSAENDIIIPVRKGVEISIGISIKLRGSVAAPVFRGEELGCAELFANGESAGTVVLAAAEDIPSRDFLFYLKLLMRSFGGK